MSNELLDLVQQQGNAWDEFKKANDQRLKAIEEKNYAPADLEEKVGKINGEITRLTDEITQLAKKAPRPGPSGKDEVTPEKEEHKTALDSYLRKGHEEGLHELERKALNTGSDPDGGYLVDYEMDGMIDRIAGTISGMRQVANVVSIGSAAYKKMVKTRGLSGGWLDEGGTSAESTEPQWSLLEIKPSKMYAESWINNEMLEDAIYNLEADIASEAGITFGETEGAAFVTGSGLGQPRGIAGYTFVANASYAWGSVGYIASGASGAFTSSAPADKLVTLQHALKQQYRPGAVWMMNDTVLATVRQMKDGSGAYYLWQPDPLGQFAGRFLGHPVVVDDNFAGLSAGSKSIAFGNMNRAYTIVDRRGTAVIRDIYTKKGVTKFHFTRRVGGGITNFEAVKFMSFATS